MSNRLICSVLDEMRKCHETRNYSYLLSLIEEAQSLANRMEASLYDNKDFSAITKKLSKATDELKDLNKQLSEKRKELGIKEKEKSYDSLLD